MGLPIVGFQDLSLTDWEGHTCLTVYTPGCNMGCPFCHSHSLIDKDTPFPTIDEDDILRRASQNKGIVEGICITGGEPTLHDLEPFLVKAKSLGLKVKLDTNGTNPNRLKKLIDSGLVDYVAMDYKASEKEMPEVCRGNFSPQRVIESRDFLINDGVDYEFRTTVVPSFHDKQDLLDMSDELHGAKRWRLQQFRGEDDFGNVLIDPEQMWLLDADEYDCRWYDDIIDQLKAEIEDIKIRGC